MSLLKRFELWVLLILIGGGLWYVFNIEDADDERGRAPIAADDSDSSGKPASPPPVSLRKTTVTRDGEHFLAEIEIRCRNDGQQALELVPPGTRLLAAGGREVPLFFLPFQPAETVPAAGESTATLRYWLSNEDINGPVSLKIGEETLPVKTGGFSAGDIHDKQSRSYTSTDWESKA